LAPPSAITDPIDANTLYSPEEAEEREEEDNGTPKGGDDKSGEMEPQSSSSSSTSKGEGREEAMLIQDVETGLEEKWEKKKESNSRARRPRSPSTSIGLRQSLELLLQQLIQSSKSELELSCSPVGVQKWSCGPYVYGALCSSLHDFITRIRLQLLPAASLFNLGAYIRYGTS